MIIGGRRVCGKTTQLIKKSSKEHLYIVCADRNRQMVITQMAKDMKLDIPFPITVEELPLRSPFIKKVLVDDIEDVLYRLIRRPIVMASTSMELLNVAKEDFSVCESFRLYKVVETIGMSAEQLQEVLNDATGGFPEMQIDHIVGTKIILGFESALNAKGRAELALKSGMISATTSNCLY